jgi:hypothetical protein
MIRELFRSWRAEVRFNHHVKMNRMLRMDEAIYGCSFLYQKERSRLNPLRYIIGKTKQYRLDPRTTFIGKHTEVGR